MGNNCSDKIVRPYQAKCNKTREMGPDGACPSSDNNLKSKRRYALLRRDGRQEMVGNSGRFFILWWSKQQEIHSARATRKGEGQNRMGEEAFDE